MQRHGEKAWRVKVTVAQVAAHRENTYPRVPDKAASDEELARRHCEMRVVSSRLYRRYALPS